MDDVAELAVGQRWQEVDPRFTRVVEIAAINRDATVTLQLVREDGTLAPRLSRASMLRFNGKRGGYKRCAHDACSVNGSNGSP
jgi:hypothetical protein